MSYVPNTDAERRQMLAAIGANCIDELFEQVPAGVRLREPLRLPAALSELELVEHCKALARRNQSTERSLCFLGGGAYDHFIPAIVDVVAQRSEFYTAYTPYQPEASQGSLQAFFEFQSLLCELTGMDVANASLYDGATAAVEAALMAMAVTGRRGKVVVPESLHPHGRQTLATYLRNQGSSIVEVPAPGGTVEPDAIGSEVDEATACVIIQQPNFFGLLEEAAAVAEVAHRHGALLVLWFDPLSLGLLRTPGDYGADIAVAEGQSLGIPLQYGGPYLGIIATRQQFVRRLPGRIVGQTTDRNGRTCYVLTLQTREQHIRREKATSNICTNQGLMALRATVYLAALGRTGLREVAELCCRKAHYAAERLASLPGVRLRFDRPFFKEFVIELPGPAAELCKSLAGQGIMVGPTLGRWYRGMENCLLVAVTERRAKEQIDLLAEAVERSLAR